jgi:hypothetical protein
MRSNIRPRSKDGGQASATPWVDEGPVSTPRPPGRLGVRRPAVARSIVLGLDDHEHRDRGLRPINCARSNTEAPPESNAPEPHPVRDPIAKGPEEEVDQSSGGANAPIDGTLGVRAEAERQAASALPADRLCSPTTSGGRLRRVTPSRSCTPIARRAASDRGHAYDEPAAEGWTTRPVRGAFVSPAARPTPAGSRAPGRAPACPDVARPGAGPTRRHAPRRTPGAPSPRTGRTSASFHDLIGRAYCRAIRRGRGVLLSYGRLRTRALWRGRRRNASATRGLAATADDVHHPRQPDGDRLLARALVRAT